MGRDGEMRIEKWGMGLGLGLDKYVRKPRDGRFLLWTRVLCSVSPPLLRESM